MPVHQKGEDVEAKEKMKIVSGAVILLTLGVLVLLSTFGIYSLDKSWPILIIVFALFTLVQSHRDLGGWVMGAAMVIVEFSPNGRDGRLGAKKRFSRKGSQCADDFRVDGLELFHQEGLAGRDLFFFRVAVPRWAAF